MPKEETDIAKVFGELIKELRDEKDLTQEKLAELSKLHTNYISLLERGKRRATIETIYKLAGALGISTSSLMKKVEEQLEKENT